MDGIGPRGGGTKRRRGGEEEVTVTKPENVTITIGTYSGVHMPYMVSARLVGIIRGGNFKLLYFVHQWHRR